jgi:hypothetical protein
MIPVLDSLQRIAATVMVAGLYLLPATLGGLVSNLDVELETIATPERVAAYIMEIPAAASAPAPTSDEPKEASKPQLPERKDDVLGVDGGVPIASKRTARQTSGESTAKSRKRGKGKRQQRCMASTGQISNTGGNRYQVERALLDYYMGNTDEAARLGNASWHRDDDGDINGISVRRVRCGSPVDEAGIEQGDIIRTANGKKVDSMAGVIALWWQLRTKDSVRLVVTRNGKRKRLIYSLV